MKRVLTLLLVLAWITSGWATGIVDNGAGGEDSLSIPIYSLDSIGNPQAIAAGDSVYVMVFNSSGVVAFRDSMAGNDGSITTGAWEDWGGADFYNYSESVAKLDGTANEGVYTYVITVDDVSVGLETIITGSFQLYDTRTLSEVLDFLTTTNLIASDNIGINWADVSNPTTTVNLTQTTIDSTREVGTVGGAVVADDTMSTGDSLGTKENQTSILAYFDTLIYDGPRGPGVYLDSAAGNTNTVLGTDGTAKNPVSTIAAAKTLATALGYNRYYFLNASTFNDAANDLASSHQYWEFIGIGNNNALAFGTQRVDESRFENMDLSGTMHASGGDVLYTNCTFGYITANFNGHAFNCWLADTIVVKADQDIDFARCQSGVAGNRTPTIDLSGGSSVVQLRAYSGGIRIMNGASTDTMSIETDGQVIISANNTSTNITVRGMLTLTDSGTTTNLTKDAVFSRTEAPSWVWTYDMGIWIDDGASNTNTVAGVDGTRANPVSTFAAARTLADALGYQKYYLVNNTNLTLAATHEDWEFIGIGEGNLIDFGSQDIDNSHFEHMMISGTQGGTGIVGLHDCYLNTIDSLEAIVTNSSFSDTISLRVSTNTVFDQCYSHIAGNASPGLDFNSAGTIDVEFRHYSGGLTLFNGTPTHTISYEADGQLVIDASCTSINVSARGNMTITDNGTTSSITKDAVFSRQEADLWVWANADTTHPDSSEIGVWLVNNLSGAAGGLDTLSTAFVVRLVDEINSYALYATKGAVGGTPSTTGFSSAALTEIGDDHWKDNMFVMFTGNRAGEGARITAFTSATDSITFTPAFAGAPSVGDSFFIFTLISESGAAGASNWSDAQRDSVLDNMKDGAITNTKIATDAIGNDELADDLTFDSLHTRTHVIKNASGTGTGLHVEGTGMGAWLKSTGSGMSALYAEGSGSGTHGIKAEGGGGGKDFFATLDLDDVSGQRDSIEFADDYYHAIAVASDSGAAATVPDSLLEVATKARSLIMNPLPGSIIPNGHLQIAQDDPDSTDPAGWGTNANSYLTSRRAFEGYKRSFYVENGSINTLQMKLDTGYYEMAAQIWFDNATTDTAFFQCYNSADEAQTWLSSGTSVEYAVGWTGWRRFARLIYLVGDTTFYFTIGANVGDSAYFAEVSLMPYGAVGHTLAGASITYAGIVDTMFGHDPTSDTTDGSVIDTVFADYIVSTLRSVGKDGISPGYTTLHLKVGAYSGAAGDDNNIKDDIAAISIGSGSGANACTIYVKAGSDFIQGVNVRLEASGGTDYYDNTDSDGKAVFALDDGTYYGYATITGHTQDVIPDTFTFTADYNDTLLMTAFAPTAPAGDLTTLYNWIVDGNDQGIKNIVVEAYIPEKFWPVKNTNKAIRARHSTKTDSTGLWELQIFGNDIVLTAQGDSSSYWMVSDEDGTFKHKVTVSSDSTTQLMVPDAD